MKKRVFKNTKLTSILMVDLFVVFFLLFAFEAKASWRFWGEAEESCEGMVNELIRGGIFTLQEETKTQRVQNSCFNIIKKTGDYKELYAYYKLYKYADELNDKYNKTNSKDNDLAPNNIYHYTLFYANQNSREFDSKTQSFKKEQGLYEKELKEFEDNMTQEERIKAFAYIADNVATGKEGWVKVYDYRKSFEYLKRAAEAGDYVSQGVLGVRNFLGTDRYNQFAIEKNYIEGYKWIYLSSLHSVQDTYYRDLSLKAFNILKQKMTAQQIQQAKNLAKIWLEENSVFVKKHPLKIIKATKEEIDLEKSKTNKFIKEYNLNKPLQTKNN